MISKKLKLIQFFDASSSKTIEDFVFKISKIKTRGDYESFFSSFGISRTDSRFWSIFDSMVKNLKDETAIEAGMPDLNGYGVVN